MLGLKQQSVTTVFQSHKELLCCNCTGKENEKFVQFNTHLKSIAKKAKNKVKGTNEAFLGRRQERKLKNHHWICKNGHLELDVDNTRVRDANVV
jgi:hypothetical protein